MSIVINVCVAYYMYVRFFGVFFKRSMREIFVVNQWKLYKQATRNVEI